MKFLKKILHGKRGISMVEAVIALAMVGIISFTAILITGNSNSIYTDALARLNARALANDSLTSFQYADNILEYEQALSITNQTFVPSGEDELSENYRYDAMYYYFDSIRANADDKTITLLDQDEVVIEPVLKCQSATEYNRAVEFLNNSPDHALMGQVSSYTRVTQQSTSYRGSTQNTGSIAGSLELNTTARTIKIAEGPLTLYYKDGKFYSQSGSTWYEYTIKETSTSSGGGFFSFLKTTTKTYAWTKGSAVTSLDTAIPASKNLTTEKTNAVNYLKNQKSTFSATETVSYDYLKNHFFAAIAATFDGNTVALLDPEDNVIAQRVCDSEASFITALKEYNGGIYAEDPGNIYTYQEQKYRTVPSTVADTNRLTADYEKNVGTSTRKRYAYEVVTAVGTRYSTTTTNTDSSSVDALYTNVNNYLKNKDAKRVSAKYTHSTTSTERVSSGGGGKGGYGGYTTVTVVETYTVEAAKVGNGYQIKRTYTKTSDGRQTDSETKYYKEPSYTWGTPNYWGGNNYTSLTYDQFVSALTKFDTERMDGWTYTKVEAVYEWAGSHIEEANVPYTVTYTADYGDQTIREDGNVIYNNDDYAAFSEKQHTYNTKYGIFNNGATFKFDAYRYFKTVTVNYGEDFLGMQNIGFLDARGNAIYTLEVNPEEGDLSAAENQIKAAKFDGDNAFTPVKETYFYHKDGYTLNVTETEHYTEWGREKTRTVSKTVEIPEQNFECTVNYADKTVTKTEDDTTYYYKPTTAFTGSGSWTTTRNTTVDDIDGAVAYLREHEPTTQYTVNRTAKTITRKSGFTTYYFSYTGVWSTRSTTVGDVDAVLAYLAEHEGTTGYTVDYTNKTVTKKSGSTTYYYTYTPSGDWTTTRTVATNLNDTIAALSANAQKLSVEYTCNVSPLSYLTILATAEPEDAIDKEYFFTFVTSGMQFLRWQFQNSDEYMDAINAYGSAYQVEGVGSRRQYDCTFGEYRIVIDVFFPGSRYGSPTFSATVTRGDDEVIYELDYKKGE